MSIASKELSGQADNKTISEIVKRLLTHNQTHMTVNKNSNHFLKVILFKNINTLKISIKLILTTVNEKMTSIRNFYHCFYLQWLEFINDIFSIIFSTHINLYNFKSYPEPLLKKIRLNAHIITLLCRNPKQVLMRTICIKTFQNRNNSFQKLIKLYKILPY
jgi:hypothetical protein